MPYADKEKKRQADKRYRESNREYYRLKAKEHYEKGKTKVTKTVDLTPYQQAELLKAERCKSFPRNEESIRFKDELEYSYSAEKCANEYKRLLGKTGDFGSTSFHTKIVLTYQPHYYEFEKRLWREDVNGIRDFLLANRLKYVYKDEYQINDKEILRGFKISGKHIGFTHFDPLYVKAFIDKYDVKSLYDPTSGWGQRLLGCAEIDYIGNDFDSRTVDGLRRMIKDFNIPNSVVTNHDCRYFTPECDYEAVFTCPPYFNTEIYQGKEFKDISDYDDFLTRMIGSSLKSSVKVVGIVINHLYEDNVKKACELNGLTYIETIELGKRYNHFHRGEKNVVKSEVLIILTLQKR